MSELERLVVLLAYELMSRTNGAALPDELVALLETIDTRSESARQYHKGPRGIDALERVRAREVDEEPDYPAARARARVALLET